MGHKDTQRTSDVTYKRPSIDQSSSEVGPSGWFPNFGPSLSRTRAMVGHLQEHFQEHLLAISCHGFLARPLA